MSGVDVVGGYDNELFWPCLIVKFSIHSLIMLEECSKLLWKITMTPANYLSLLGSSELDKNLLDEASASAQPQNALFVCLFNFWSQTFPLHHRLHKLILSHLKMKPFSCWFSYVFYYFYKWGKIWNPPFRSFWHPTCWTETLQLGGLSWSTKLSTFFYQSHRKYYFGSIIEN